MRVRLTRKLANVLDGVDVSPYGVGEVFELPDAQARLLIAENWAVREKARRWSGVRGRRRSDVERRWKHRRAS